MTLRRGFVVAAMVLSAIAAFYLLQRQLANVWLSLALAGDVRDVIDRSAEDQKTLRRLDPRREAEYRRRFEEIEATRRRLEIVSISRQDLAARLRTVLIVGFVVVVLPLLALWIASRRSEERRLAAVREGLVALSRGEPPRVTETVKGRDTIARIAAMIESTYRQMRADRQRIESLRNLEQWQEAARRHAHELRTPLTAARLELERLGSTSSDPAALRSVESIRHDFDRLQAFTKEFTSFAAIGRPRVEPVPLRTFLHEFATTFASAWPQLEIQVAAGVDACAMIDREMIRRVLMNLGSNAAQALDARAGSLELSIVRSDSALEVHVTDDGPGVDDAIRDRLFDPYVTTRGVGEGMGLGLAIARKITLDHGGDLRLVASRPGRTEFALVLPEAEPPC